MCFLMGKVDILDVMLIDNLMIANMKSAKNRIPTTDLKLPQKLSVDLGLKWETNTWLEYLTTTCLFSAERNGP